MTKERQAELIHDACVELGLDGHIKWIEKHRDAYTEAERLADSARYGDALPVKNSYMFCDSLDMCFFYDRGNHASIAYSGRTFHGASDIKDGNIIKAFELAAKVLARMQELADAEHGQ